MVTGDLHIRKIVVLPSIAQFNYLIPIVSFCNEMNFIRGKMSPDEKFFFFLISFSLLKLLLLASSVGFNVSSARLTS
jgi:hypothetical protein